MISITHPKTSVAIALKHAAEYLETLLGPEGRWVTRDYHDHKASQLLDAKADLLIAEARIESWEVDLGFNGCQGDSC